MIYLAKIFSDKSIDGYLDGSENSDKEGTGFGEKDPGDGVTKHTGHKPGREEITRKYSNPHPIAPERLCVIGKIVHVSAQLP